MQFFGQKKTSVRQFLYVVVKPLFLVNKIVKLTKQCCCIVLGHGYSGHSFIHKFFLLTFTSMDFASLTTG